MNSIVAGILIRLGVKAALALHKGPAHELAEKYRKEIEAADAQKKKDQIKKAMLMLLVCASMMLPGCMAYKRAFVATHDAIDDQIAPMSEKQIADSAVKSVVKEQSK